MSGRSAYVRKKITETKPDRPPVGHGFTPRGRPRSTASDETATMGDRNEYHDARYAPYEQPRDSQVTYGSHSSGGSVDGRRDPAQSLPLNESAYARVRRPAVRADEATGIEKSGLRSAVDKKSEGVRRGLAKAFTFGKKAKAVEERPSSRGVNSYTANYAYSHTPVQPPTALTTQMHAMYDDDYDDFVQNQDRHRQHAHAQAALEGWDAGSGTHTRLPPVPVASSASIKRWIGAGRPVQRWNKLRKDPELWDPNGDVLVFFGQRGQQPRAPPSFRLSSHIIEATESRFLLTLLREGSTEEDVQLPPSPAGAPPMLQRHLHLHPHPHPHAPGKAHTNKGNAPTPPTSESASLGDTDGQISYEMYFATPAGLSKTEQLRHQLATRNVFALLYHASLVGLSLHQALGDLHARLEAYMPADTDNVGTMINYLQARGIDDVRGDADNAVALLAWSEQADVRWEEGWRESFLHCAGMHARLETTADFRSVSPITRALLERASLETQLRVQAAEERLAEFQYGDLWPAAFCSHGEARAAADRAQKFLQAHYARAFGRWPPAPVLDDDAWLTRTVAQTLQRDFAALYDYLVDRDIVWDVSEARAGRKWLLVSAAGNRAFDADAGGLPMTDVLVEHDNKQRFPHMPHPYPLVPESVPPANANGKKKGTGSERRVQLAYTVATNMLVLGAEFQPSDLIDAFCRFEKTDRVGDVDPALARRARWVVVYGVLQTLASVAVDAPGMRYREGVAYHLSPRLPGARMPPWRAQSQSHYAHHIHDVAESAHEQSHCWTVPATWTDEHEHEHEPEPEPEPGSSERGGSTFSRADARSGRSSQTSFVGGPGQTGQTGQTSLSAVGYGYAYGPASVVSVGSSLSTGRSKPRMAKARGPASDVGTLFRDFDLLDVIDDHEP